MINPLGTYIVCSLKIQDFFFFYRTVSKFLHEKSASCMQTAAISGNKISLEITFSAILKKNLVNKRELKKTID